jgi:hypothetical protein
MESNNNDQRTRAEQLQDTNEEFPDMTPRRIGGDDSLAEASPIDYRADEKVLTNRNRNYNSDRANDNDTVGQDNDDKKKTGSE